MKRLARTDAHLSKHSRNSPGTLVTRDKTGTSLHLQWCPSKGQKRSPNFDEAAEHIKIAGRGSLGKCYCRHETWRLGKNCSAPIDDICISFGAASDFLAEQGFAKRASVEELLDTLKRAEDSGLVHVGDNRTKRRLSATVADAVAVFSKESRSTI